jgi:hypothetical protein
VFLIVLQCLLRITKFHALAYVFHCIILGWHCCGNFEWQLFYIYAHSISRWLHHSAIELDSGMCNHCHCLFLFVSFCFHWVKVATLQQPNEVSAKWLPDVWLTVFFQKFTSVTKWATFSLCDCSHPMITIYHIYKHMVLTECHLLAPLSAHTTISTWANKPPRQKHLILFGCFPTKVGQHVANRGAQSCLAHAALREAPPSLDAVSWLPR